MGNTVKLDQNETGVWSIHIMWCHHKGMADPVFILASLHRQLLGYTLTQISTVIIDSIGESPTCDENFLRS